MNARGWLALVVMMSVYLYAESICAHARVKRQASQILQDFVRNGSLTTLAPETDRFRVSGAEGSNGPDARSDGVDSKTTLSRGAPGPPGPQGRSKNFRKTFPRIRLTLSRLKRLQRLLQFLISLDAELIPNWVQLSFHECFGYAGCNGCLDLNNPSNFGLAPTFRLAMDIRDIIAPYMSKADFIALLGTEAAKAGAVNGGGSLNLPFSTGRRDCRRPLRDFNLPTGEITNTVSLLRRQFRLSTRESVALMGAHSLGRARPENTGFDGPWDRSETALDPGYFFVLNSDSLQAERVDNDRTKSTQWKTGGFLMLHADLILRKRFTTSGTFDVPSCGATTNVTDCPDQRITAPMTREFQDTATFHAEFSKAYLKMITKSWYRLTRIE